MVTWLLVDTIVLITMVVVVVSHVVVAIMAHVLSQCR